MTENLRPMEFDGYRLVRPIGRGAMGEVFLAHDVLLDRSVAVKLLSHASRGAEARRRFFVEARAIARLQHPNVVSIYRVGEVADCPYLVSELVRGTGLDQLPMPIDGARVLRIAMGLARGLAAAHQRGVVHRDIKPANAILADDGEVKLLDFGIAKLLDDPTSDRLDARAPISEAAAPDDCTAEVEVVPDAAAALTRAGAVLGTPAYMAPEVWRGEAADPRSDVYSLGALLFTLLAGRPPHRASTLAELRDLVLGTDAPHVETAAKDADRALCAIVDRCLRRDPSARFANANEVRAALVQLTPEARGGIVPDGNPYRGLSAFEAEHRGVYFGRDSELRTVLERLAVDPAVVVVGDSGIGKSSLCRAGVLPRVGTWLDRSRAWTTLTVVPGRRPVATLAAALAGFLDASEASVERTIERDPSEIGRALRRACGNDRGLVLFVDQLEEIVTHASVQERAAVAEALGWLTIPIEGVRLLVSLRGDFVSRIAVVPRLGDGLSRSLYFLRPLSRERVREVIVAPAQAKGVSFENETMIAELVDGAVRTDGGLPLLQFALAELWEARDASTHVLTASALASVGGVAGALARYADRVVAAMTKEERDAARRILTRLVSNGGTRVRRSAGELLLDAPSKSALDALVRGRLLVARETPEGTSVEIAHEALAAGWPTLEAWLVGDAGSRLVHDRLAIAAAEWDRLGKRREALWSKRQLAEADALDLETLAPCELAFLASSRRSIRRATWLRAFAVAAAPIAVAVTYGSILAKSSRDAARTVDAHVQAADAAIAVMRDARANQNELRIRAFESFDARRRDDAERIWADSLAIAPNVRAAASRASQELETALLVSPTRRDVRGRLADLLLERAAAAEEARRFAERDELLQRLALYDEDGSRRARWNAPATLELVSVPAGAQLTIERYAARRDGSRALEPVEPPSVGPASLSPGSYRITLSLPGRATVRYPIVLSRGEHVRREVALPPAATIPDGFVYVPEGRFSFGSAAEEPLRKGFFNAAPLHETTSGAFLVARRETTFGEYLAFLDSAPAAERAKHVPRTEKGGFQGGLTVERDPAGRWKITLQPAARAYVASEGEALVIPGRSRRVSQDWRELPVVGVSFEDARDYAAWLDRSGRVPGARLCTEREWERAARGADDREYPHGDSLLADDADFDATYAKDPAAMGPDVVGSHPASRSPFDVDDLAGNVWEWTVSSLADDERVVRGGSYYFDANSSRSSNREVPEPSFRDVTVGFRVCATPR